MEKVTIARGALLDIGLHWDYEGPDFPEGIRIFPNGTWSPK